MPRLASIDIGSNTVRLLIMEGSPGGPFREIGSDRRITRLGEGMDGEKRLLDSRMESTMDVLAAFVKKCRDYGEIPIRVVATSAVREAVNKDDFLNMAREKLGLVIEVISWEEEARLTLAGALWKIDDRGRSVLTFDIGGGSTEFILSQGKTILKSAGTSLGVVRLTEKFIARHPVDPAELGRLQKHIQDELAQVKRQLGSERPELLVGTAGTVTTLAALHKNIFPYDPDKIHQTVLSRQTVQNIFNDLKGKTLAERIKLKPLEPGREDLIIAGTAIVLETMKTFACDNLTVSEHALREGLLLQNFEQRPSA